MNTPLLRLSAQLLAGMSFAAADEPMHVIAAAARIVHLLAPAVDRTRRALRGEEQQHKPDDRGIGNIHSSLLLSDSDGRNSRGCHSCLGVDPPFAP